MQKRIFMKNYETHAVKMALKRFLKSERLHVHGIKNDNSDLVRNIELLFASYSVQIQLCLNRKDLTKIDPKEIGFINKPVHCDAWKLVINEYKKLNIIIGAELGIMFIKYLDMKPTCVLDHRDNIIFWTFAMNLFQLIDNELDRKGPIDPNDFDRIEKIYFADKDQGFHLSLLPNYIETINNIESSIGRFKKYSKNVWKTLYIKRQV